MIISCKKCNKKFEVNSDLIPDEGRLLQCSVCNHEWFFKSVISKNVVKTEVFGTDNNFKSTSIPKKDEFNIKADLVDQEILINNEPEGDSFNNNKKKWKSFTNINKKKEKEKKINILSIIIIFIISFIAIIILLDTFKYSISKIIPNFEFVLFNLYETIKDILLFFKDLI
jgi:predicted Zn finger-like uncharacterized protein